MANEFDNLQDPNPVPQENTALTREKLEMIGFLSVGSLFFGGAITAIILTALSILTFGVGMSLIVVGLSIGLGSLSVGLSKKLAADKKLTRAQNPDRNTDRSEVLKLVHEGQTISATQNAEFLAVIGNTHKNVILPIFNGENILSDNLILLERNGKTILEHHVTFIDGTKQKVEIEAPKIVPKETTRLTKIRNMDSL